MKRFLSILLMLAMVVPLFTVLLTLGVFAETAAVYDKPTHTDETDGSVGLTFDGTVDNGKTCADDNYRPTKRFSDVPHTFQAWVYLPEAYESTSAGVIMGNKTANNDTRGAHLTFSLGGNRVPQILYYDDLLVDHEVKFTKSAIPVGKWTMLTVVWDGETGYVSCYLNGVLSEQASFLPDLHEHVNELPLALGGDYTMMNTSYFRGGLQDDSLYATARTAAEVKADYQKGVNVNDPELLCHYDVDASDKGKDIADASGNGNDLQYSKTWLTEEDMEAIRANYSFTPSYAFAAIGDTQKTTYREAITNAITTPTAENSATYRMYKWLVDNKTSRNIQLVMGMGDITDANLAPEWALMQQAVAQMDTAGMNYTLIRGNHDSYTNTKEGYTGLGDTGFDTYFGKNATGSAYYKQVSDHGGFYDTNSVRNTYRKLTVGNTKWLIICLDYRASNSVMTWAGNLCASNPDHKVIITTHIYLNAEGEPISYGGLSDSPNNGDDKWNKLASQYANVEMVLSGHIGSERLVTTQVKGVNGNTVTQMLIDSQDSDGSLGGCGYVALYRFNADGSEFYTEYYSVEKDRYLLTANQFYVDLEAEGTEQTLIDWDPLRGNQPSGSGTEASPYLISHVKHLVWMAYQVEYNDHKVYFTNTYFKQVCDIDLQGYLLQSIGGYFKTATGSSADLNAKAFGGHYDGGGYVIKNGTIVPCHPDKSLNKRKQFGLFGCIYGATIENVVLEDVCIVGRGPTGGIVGKAMAPWDGSADVGFNKIISCHVGEGVELRTWHPAPVYNAEYDGEYKMAVGGICGIAYATLIQGCTAANTFRTSGVFSGMLGGIAGTAGYNTVIDHCAFTGGIEVMDTHYAASVSIGGIVGCMSPHRGSFVDVDHNRAPMVGGLKISNCYNTGYYEFKGTVAVDVVDKTNGYNINNKNIHWGGMIGHAGSMLEIPATAEEPYPYLIENCYNLYAEQRGELEKSTGKYVTGGIIGRSTANKTVSNAYWLKNCYSVKVDAGGLNGTTSTNEYRCDATGLTSGGLPATQVVPGSTVATRTVEQMRADVLNIDVGIARIRDGVEEAAVWYFGSGVPTVASVKAGDFYLNTETGKAYVYLPYQVNEVYDYSEWMLMAGLSGERGSRWYTGIGMPSLQNVLVGDMYMDTQSGDVYRYNGGAWLPAGNLSGPQGEPGEQGIQGEKGDKGDAGEKGADGADGTQSDSPNAGSMSSSSDRTPTKQGNNILAVVALVIGLVLLVGNVVFVIFYFVSKKEKA